MQRRRDYLFSLKHGDGILLDQGLHEPTGPKDSVIQANLQQKMVVVMRVVTDGWVCMVVGAIECIHKPCT